MYNVYYPLLVIMIGTACRCGEIIGLTWSDVDMAKKQVVVDHQLIYKNFGEGTKFYITTPKTEAGNRTIPMTHTVRHAFEQQKEYQFMLGIDRDVAVDAFNKKELLKNTYGRGIKLKNHIL